MLGSVLQINSSLCTPPRNMSHFVDGKRNNAVPCMLGSRTNLYIFSKLLPRRATSSRRLNKAPMEQALSPMTLTWLPPKERFSWWLSCMKAPCKVGCLCLYVVTNWSIRTVEDSGRWSIYWKVLERSEESSLYSSKSDESASVWCPRPSSVALSSALFCTTWQQVLKWSTQAGTQRKLP